MGYRAAEERVRTSVMEDARGRGCDVRGLAAAYSELQATDP